MSLILQVQFFGSKRVETSVSFYSLMAIKIFTRKNKSIQTLLKPTQKHPPFSNAVPSLFHSCLVIVFNFYAITDLILMGM